MTTQDRAGGSEADGSRARSFATRAHRADTGVLVTKVMPVDEAMARWWANAMWSPNVRVYIDLLDDDYNVIHTEVL